MSKLSLVILIFGFSLQTLSCSKEAVKMEVKPLIGIDLKIRNSKEWKSAAITVNFVRFFELSDDHNGSAIGTVQNWNGRLLNFDLKQEETKTILEEPYWESTLIGIDPDFLGTTFLTMDDVLVNKIEIEYVEFIPFDDQIKIEDGQEYLVNLTMDLDEILTKTDMTYFFKTSMIKAKITKL